MALIAQVQPTCGSEAVVAAILSTVHARTGIDFSAYRTSTVYRRILNRMMSVGLDSFERYLELLHSSADEPSRLVERMTIKVSRFYRNKPTFDCLREQLIPRLMREKGGAPLRVWSVGCGCGEEVYTLAMLLDEAGAEAIIEGTDVDPTALAAAALGIYRAASLEELPSSLARRYLEPPGSGTAGCYRVRDCLRERVRLSRHDITVQATAPGGGHFDVISCRNVLIYLQRAWQERVAQSLRRALNDGGILCLGEAEWPPPTVAATLEVLGRSTRLFRAPPARHI